MRPLLVASLSLGLAFVLGGCCGGKKTEPAPTTTTTPTTDVKKGDIEPVGCRGMKDAAACSSCCDPKYWTASFKNGQCQCIKK
jgi:hypothetical protein